MSNKVARYISMALGAWLVVSAFVLPHQTKAAAFHYAIIGLAIALVSFMGAREHIAWPSMHRRHQPIKRRFP